MEPFAGPVSEFIELLLRDGGEGFGKLVQSLSWIALIDWVREHPLWSALVVLGGVFALSAKSKTG